MGVEQVRSNSTVFRRWKRGGLFVLFFSVEKASQKVMEQKGMILGNPGTEGEADSGLTLAWGRPGTTPGRGEPKGPSPPCDFKWGH